MPESKTPDAAAAVPTIPEIRTDSKGVVDGVSTAAPADFERSRDLVEQEKLVAMKEAISDLKAQELQDGLRRAREELAVEAAKEGKDSGPERKGARANKMNRFHSKVVQVMLQVRDLKTPFYVGGGRQTFKWLAYAAKFRYSQKHKYQIHPDKMVVADVIDEESRRSLMPLESICSRVSDNSRIYIRLRPAPRENEVYVPTTWETIAYTPPVLWTWVWVKPNFSPDPWEELAEKARVAAKAAGARVSRDGKEDTRNPFEIRLHCNVNGWWDALPVSIQQRKDKSWSVRSKIMCPPQTELQFYFTFDGEKKLAANYETKTGNPGGRPTEINYYKPKMTAVRIRDAVAKQRNAGAQDLVEADDSESDDEEYVEQEIKFEHVEDLSEDEKKLGFENDWDEVQLLDIVRAAEDRDAIKGIVKRCWMALRDIFQCIAGLTAPVEFMTSLQFIKFCRESRLFRFGLNSTLASIIFKRVNIMEDFDEADVNRDVRGGLNIVEDDSNPESLFVRSEWIESLVRIADYWDMKNTGIVEKFNSVLRAVRRKWDPEVKKMLEIRENIRIDLQYQRAFEPNIERIFILFEAYASLGKTVADTPTLSEKEFEQFTKQFNLNLLSNYIKPRMMPQIYAYSQGPSLEDDRGYQTEFAEFTEILARTAILAFPRAKVAIALQKLFAYLMEAVRKQGLLKPSIRRRLGLL